MRTAFSGMIALNELWVTVNTAQSRWNRWWSVTWQPLYLGISAYVFTLRDQPDLWICVWIMLSWKDWNNKIDFRNNDWSSSIIDRSPNQHSSCHIKWVSLNHELVSISFLTSISRQIWKSFDIFDEIAGKSFKNHVKITCFSTKLNKWTVLLSKYRLLISFFRRYKFHFDNPFFRFCILSLILCVPILTNFSYSQAGLNRVTELKYRIIIY